jgi:hypothetical protein
MASAAVFVDDAVLGRLPGVCVKTGAPADRLVRLDKRLGRSPLIWLLVLLGPLGWIVLLAALMGGERLTIRLPMADPGLDRSRRWARITSAGMVLFVIGVVVTFYGRDPIGLSLVAAGAGTTIVAMVIDGLTSIGIDLDASRRWVTLNNVHPAFVEALQSAQRADQRIGG